MDNQRWAKPVKIKKKSLISAKKAPYVKRRLLVILLFVVMLWAALSFISSDFFNIETIAVYGNTHTAEREIRLALSVAEGDNIWQVNKAQQEAKLTAIPRIESTRVTRKLPNTLKVDVKEKRTLLFVPYNGYFLEIGSDGMVLATTGKPQDYNVPLLTGLAPIELAAGEMMLTDFQLQEVTQALDAMVATGVSASELNFAEADNLVIITMDGLTVWLGQGDYSEKAALLGQIMVQLQGRQAEGYLDLRVPGAPVFRIIGEEKTQKNN